MNLERKTEEEVQEIARRAVEDAIAHIESNVDPERNKAQRFYNGESDVAHNKGRSSIVATKCRDVVKQVMPSLLRVFLSNDKPAEFVPRTPADVAGAEQATNFAEYKMEQNDGYTVLRNAFHDALVKKAGIVKAYYDETSAVKVEEYTGLTNDEFMSVASDPDAEILEHTEMFMAESAPDGSEITVTTHDAKVSYTRDAGDIKITSIPPEDFFVDEKATCIDDAYAVGHRTEMTVGDLVEMGYDFNDVWDLGSDDNGDESEQARRGHSVEDNQSSSLDPTSRAVSVYEVYMKIDIEGTGSPLLYSLVLAGASMKLLSYDNADFVPLAVFSANPEPHSFFSPCLVELIMEDQNVMTSLWRGMLDNISITNNPGVAYNDGVVNTADILNKEIGKVVRVKGQPGAQITPFTVPFTAGQTIPAMEYYDQLIQDKTGVSRASMGLDPDALQNTTATAVNAAVGAADDQIEAMARNLGEGGLRQLYAILLKLIRQHATAEEIIKVNGSFVPVDPRGWSSDMSVSINVGLGRGGKSERMATLQQTLQQQFTIMQSPGIAGSLVSLTQIRNTLADIQALGGVYNSDRYYSPMNPQMEAQLKHQAAQAAQAASQGQTDPNMINAQAVIAAEQIKAQAKKETDIAKLRVDGQKAMAEEQRKRAELGIDNDLARDKMVQELAIEVAKIMGQYGTSVDVAAVQAAQAAPRMIGGSNA